MTSPWQALEVASDSTHHVVDKQPAYASRFLSVLKFHEPGLAPATDFSGAFHINFKGEPAYSSRFLRTFGYYQGLAAVQDASGWFHILPSGEPAYTSRFAWCGNFQDNLCAVKNEEGEFFHINAKGEKAYPRTFRYVGDFKEGFAVVQNSQGFHTHIDPQGNWTHGQWFLNLDIYHKGFARAQDQQGWFHIDLEGQAIYAHRYKSVEPFYNGIARVEAASGAIYRINEQGKQVETLRESEDHTFHEVSAELVSYWRFFTIQMANDLSLFDRLPNRLETLPQLLALPASSTLKLLKALEEMNYVERKEDHWDLTPKGALFHSSHPLSLKDASTLWKEEHLTSWQQIHYSLKTEKPAFNHLFGKGWFEWLEDHPEKNRLYHQAISKYAKKDYQTFCEKIDFSKHHHVLDIGGSTGALLRDILEKNPHLKGMLLDLPSVVQRVEIPPHLENRMRCIAAHFFDSWDSLQVDSAILSRVLHDWPDKEALQILRNAYSSLSNSTASRLYIVEKVQDVSGASGSLLDLNMLIMTGGEERTLEQFKELLDQAGFHLEEVYPLNTVSSILVAVKKEIV